jgi:putative FmdB family regulatory protein
MPLYEYECHACGNVLEALQSIREPDHGPCPNCGERLVRVVSAPRLNTGNFSGRTEARYARTSFSEEAARERELQRDYETLQIPRGVKHDPWRGDE